jgi:hypothetical protein
VDGRQFLLVYFDTGICYSLFSANQIKSTSHHTTTFNIIAVYVPPVHKAEVLGRLGDDITTEFHDDATSGLSTDGDVENKP